MFGSSFKLFSVRGIDVGADLSWLLIVALVSWSFWGRYVVWYDRDPTGALVMAVCSAVLFFGSVVVHELAHALEAQRRGVHVEGITLFVFGGATRSRFDVRRPVDEFALTAVGPYSSLVLAATFGLATVAADALDAGAVAEVLGNLGWLNLALAVFNLLPGAPLDGGRILRAAVWKVTGDRRRAIEVAAGAGRALGGGIIALGVLSFFTASGFSGIWFVLIGWFLFRAATAERMQSEVETLVEGRSARRLASRLDEIPATTSVADAIDDHFVSSDVELLLVRDGEPGEQDLGIVDVDAARAVDPGARSTTAVGAIARDPDDLHRVDADTPALEVVEQVELSRRPVLVTEGGRPIGVVEPERLARLLSRMRQLGGTDRTREPEPTG